MRARRRRRQLVGPPERATWMDFYRIGLGVLMIPLGITILGRSIAEGIVTPVSVLMGLLFIAFGAYRLYVGAVRYRTYRNHPQSQVARSSNKPHAR
jgi:hypothetical protein